MRRRGTYFRDAPKTAAGNLPAGSYADIQSRIHRFDWSNYDQSNDYSFSASSTYQDWNKVTVYLDGTLIWGQEPTESMSARVGGKSTQQQVSGPGLRVVPNPVRGEAWAVVNLEEAAEARVVVADITGQLVLVQDLGVLPRGSQRRRLGLEGLSSGVYFAALQVRSPEGLRTLATFKLAVAR